MKAIVQDTYGDAEVLALRDVERPAIGEDQVLVEVRAAGVDPGVWIFMTGLLPYAVRPVSGMRRPRVGVRGRAFAGVVAEAGTRVTRFRPGDEVYGTSDRGTFAEYTVAREDRMAAMPGRLSFTEAAAVPISGVTALQAVRGNVREGGRVLVVGAAGGVGTFAVQIAAALGARVTAVCGPGKTELVRSIGAEDVIDYTHAEVDRDGPRYDLIIDIAGLRRLSLLRRALKPRGTLMLIGGGHDRRRVLGGMVRQFRAPVAALFSGQRLRPLLGLENTADLEELTALIESGEVSPVIDRTYPLAQAADAIRHLEAGHPAGKIVVTVTDRTES